MGSITAGLADLAWTNSWAILDKAWAPTSPSLPVPSYPPSILRSTGRVLAAQSFQDRDPPDVEQNICEKAAEPEKGREGLFIAWQLR